MSFIYAMSDIHGFYREMYKRLDQLGNLQPMIDGKDNTWLGADVDFKTSKTFLNEEQFEKVKELAIEGNLRESYSYVRGCIKKNHKDLINWMRKLPYFYETDNQIFVHAGVDEEAEDWWKVGTQNYYFVSKYPSTTGEFYKDIIAGHIGTAFISGDSEFHDIYFDGQSHYYIDSRKH